MAFILAGIIFAVAIVAAAIMLLTGSSDRSGAFIGLAGTIVSGTVLASHWLGW
jgi:hypothetical protein